MAPFTLSTNDAIANGGGPIQRLVSRGLITYNHRMNEAIAFDTHRFVKNLTASGFTEKQAEALANEQVYLLNANLATKVDLLAVKADLSKWMVMAMIAQGGLIVALVKVL